MGQKILMWCLALFLMTGAACFAQHDAKNDERTHMILKIGETELTATLADNSSARALRKILAEEGPLTIDMRDYANMEKVGSLGTSLPRNDEQIRAEAGDIILYQGDALVIYYDSNSWNFTRIGRISGITGAELKRILGPGNVTVTLALE